MYADEAEEELRLLDAGFNSLYTWAALLDIPSYIEYVLNSSPLAAFEDLRKHIQYLQWQQYRGLGRRRVFKTPSMFGFEGAYSAVFTGTDFIVTHRHPLNFVASMCALRSGDAGAGKQSRQNRLRAGPGRSRGAVVHRRPVRPAARRSADPRKSLRANAVTGTCNWPMR